ncbi:MAG: NAD(P)H-dependent oxidoreductase [Clostridium sp.]|nr:NAD(P)H-dependent oxidoreductase [Clostridium sp.]
MEGKKAICISASNITHSREQSTSYRISKIVANVFAEKGISCRILDLRKAELTPCTGCGRCYAEKRCCRDKIFNRIYEEMAAADYHFFVAPHYAPIPAKLCMLLEKMEQITFLHWWKDNSYQSELCGRLAGIISHGGGDERAVESYKAMVNDTIANALDTVQVKVVPFNSKWNTGVALPVKEVLRKESIFPVQEYDWKMVEETVRAYVEVVVLTSKSADVIL